MLRKIDHSKMGSSHLGWLDSTFHFSFADYYNPSNMNFGVLRVLNDDLIQSKTGFPMHPHRDMEIITYVINGQLTHADSMGNKRSIKRGDVQYMSAGTGIFHSEENNDDQILRLLQLWIIPNQKGLQPNYGDYSFTKQDRRNKWLHLVSSTEGLAPVQIHQDVNIYSIELDTDKICNFDVKKDRQAYIVQIEGSSVIKGIQLDERDALEVIEESIEIKSINSSHLLLIEMKV